MTSHLSLALVAVAMACSATAEAASRTWALKGDAFSIHFPCAASVTIMPAAAPGTISIQARATDPEEIARLVFEPDRGGTTLHPRPIDAACWQPAGTGAWTPTLALAVRVPAGARLQIDDSGASAYRIGAIGGALAIDFAGHATLEDDAAKAVSLSLAGQTRITLHQVAGPLKLDAAGDSAVMVDAIDTTVLTLDLSGTYHVATGRGAIGALAMDASGQGDVAIGGTVTAARVSLSGDSHLRIADLTGPIERDISGVATVETGP